MKTTLIFILCFVSVSVFAQNIPENYNEGMKNLKEKNYSSAILYFSKAIKEDEKFEKAYLNRGICYEFLMDHEKAITDFNMVLLLNSKNALAYYNRGLIFKNTNQLNMAIEDFTNAFHLDSTNKFAIYNRALVKLQMGDFDTACVDLAIAADMGIKNAVEIIKYTCK